MADLGDLSDSEKDESAADELISQIQELCVLEQVSKINTCSFTDSLLPSHLETRFQKLKSHNPLPKSVDISLDPLKSSIPKGESEEDNPNGEKENKSKHNQFLRSLSYSSNRSSNRASNYDYPLDSPVSSRDSPSPPRKIGCFWCSPGKKKKKQNKDWGSKNDEEFLSGLSSLFSVKEQEKILKKAVKEEEKINREAEKIVKWAKQASKKLSFHEDEFTDDDIDKPKYF
ncbi:uncharacterized protein [Euphorbia lathyris]|uniref:uncharacterized protein n=1 Tax=Euphorbia lathyris TaxID=212925 RepID=UPI003313AA7C